jgi:hypothetical protein
LLEIQSTGGTLTTAPVQIDMKNNAIQHAATLIYNIPNIESTGVLYTPNKVDDMYVKGRKQLYLSILEQQHTD